MKTKAPALTENDRLTLIRQAQKLIRQSMKGAYSKKVSTALSHLTNDTDYQRTKAATPEELLDNCLQEILRITANSPITPDLSLMCSDIMEHIAEYAYMEFDESDQPEKDESGFLPFTPATLEFMARQAQLLPEDQIAQSLPRAQKLVAIYTKLAA